MKAFELVDELMSDNEHLAVSYSEIAAELRRLAAVEAERDALKAELERIKAPPTGKQLDAVLNTGLVETPFGQTEYDSARRIYATCLLIALGSKT